MSNYSRGEVVECLDTDLGRWERAIILEGPSDEKEEFYIRYQGYSSVYNSKKTRSFLRKVTHPLDCNSQKRVFVHQSVHNFLRTAKKGDEIRYADGSEIKSSSAIEVDRFKKTVKIKSGDDCEISICASRILLPEKAESAKGRKSGRMRKRGQKALLPEVPRPLQGDTNQDTAAMSATLSQDAQVTTTEPQLRRDEAEFNQELFYGSSAGSAVPSLIVKNLNQTIQPGDVIKVNGLESANLVVSQLKIKNDKRTLICHPYINKKADDRTQVFSTTECITDKTTHRCMSVLNQSRSAFASQKGGNSQLFRKAQISSRIYREVKSFLSNRKSFSHNFSLGEIDYSTDLKMFELHSGNNFRVQYQIKDNNMNELDEMLGPKWDIHLVVDKCRLITKLKIWISANAELKISMSGCTSHRIAEISDSYRQQIVEELAQMKHTSSADSADHQNHDSDSD